MLTITRPAQEHPASAPAAAAGTPRSTRRRDPVPWAVAGIVVAVDLALSLSRYARFDPASWDLGIFTQAIGRYSYAHAPISHIRGMDLLGDHWSPILALLAPIFRVFPSAVTLLVVQALLAAASVLPVYRAAVHRLDVPAARIVAACYGASWGLVDLAWVGFHEVAFAVPLLAFALSAVVRGRHWHAAAWAAPLVLVKEDQGFTAAAIGVIIAVAYRRRLAGVLLTAWGAGWSLLEVYVLIPAVNPNHVYGYWAQGGLAGLTQGWDVKAPMVALLVVPTALTAVRSPIAAAAIPAVALRLLASNEAYWGTGFHYSATVMPVLFVAAADGLARLRASQRFARFAAHAPAMMAAAAVALAFSSPLAHMWQPGTYQVDAHDRALAAAIAKVPDGASVEASMSVAAHLAARTDTYWWHRTYRPDWIVFDGDSPEWGVSARYVSQYLHGDEVYVTVFHRDGVWVFQRIP